MASSSIQACCTGCSVPSGFAKPSIVVMSLSARSAIVNAQARLSLPPTSTLHAPQLLSSQPYLQPVRRNTSRRYHSSGMAGSPVWRKCLPLMETSMPLRMGSGTILAGGVCGAWGIRPLYSLRQDGSSPDRGGATAVFIGHAAACRYGPGLNTVRVERSERSERSRNACCPSTPALRAYAQGQRIEAGPLPHGACDCVLRGRTQHLSALSARPRAFRHLAIHDRFRRCATRLRRALGGAEVCLYRYGDRRSLADDPAACGGTARGRCARRRRGVCAGRCHRCAEGALRMRAVGAGDGGCEADGAASRVGR